MINHPTNLPTIVTISTYWSNGAIDLNTDLFIKVGLFTQIFIRPHIQSQMIGMQMCTLIWLGQRWLPGPKKKSPWLLEV